MRLALALASIAMFTLTGRTVADKIDPNFNTVQIREQAGPGRVKGL